MTPPTGLTGNAFGFYLLLSTVSVTDGPWDVEWPGNSDGIGGVEVVGKSGLGGVGNREAIAESTSDVNVPCRAVTTEFTRSLDGMSGARADETECEGEQLLEGDVDWFSERNVTPLGLAVLGKGALSRLLRVCLHILWQLQWSKPSRQQRCIAIITFKAMLANPQASATKEQQCANAVATCSQAWVKTRARPSTP